jgi:hypothetical protein
MQQFITHNETKHTMKLKRCLAQNNIYLSWFRIIAQKMHTRNSRNQETKTHTSCPPTRLTFVVHNIHLQMQKFTESQHYHVYETPTQN